MLGAEGLVGQIIETGALSARVLLIDDLAHSTPVVVLRNGLRALAHGQGPGAPLSLPYLSSQDDIRLGDLLVTSGLGGRFPPGYPVARVLSVEGSTSDAFLTVRAEPMAPLRRLQDVVVLSVAGGKRPPGTGLWLSSPGRPNHDRPAPPRFWLTLGVALVLTAVATRPGASGLWVVPPPMGRARVAVLGHDRSRGGGYGKCLGRGVAGG